MERSQNIRQASTRQIVSRNLTLRGEEIVADTMGGTILGSVALCPRCGQTDNGICC